MDSTAWRATIERAFSPPGLSADGSETVGSAAVLTWERVALQLAPVIGPEGVRALYARSVHLARHRYPWLPPTDHALRADSPFANLKTGLDVRDRGDALESACSVFVTFTELLRTFIGPSLTSRLLAPVLADRDAGASAPETSQ